ncbi:hypothetical protein K2173_007010 [Erythroxylum novogranatense]|uniref:t-SNARE coiled-coil homology domain-containing protein n=1 Tax=Erythroxylum novogranatense TaxID=1862640 RepID=A0AAV8SLC5_9ROSI|nr:hypothetical protein K2173_007010 [Erythroxylum novogranatense]
MLGIKKSPIKDLKQNKVDLEYPFPAPSNPFDSDDDLDCEETLKPSKKTSSEHILATNFSTNPFDNDDKKIMSSTSSYSFKSTARNKYTNDFCDDGGLENQPVQELENYAVYKAEETTKAVNGCLKIAEEIREDATKTLITLHQQGEQIIKTHNIAVEMDHDLSRGEKLLGSLGGIFSKKWTPKKTPPITGPAIARDFNTAKTMVGHLEQREKLGLNPASKGRSDSRAVLLEPTNAIQKVEVEKAEQDDALSDLSNLLGELKDMAVDMGIEIDRQTKALDHAENDVDTLNMRVRGANQRARRLLGK